MNNFPESIYRTGRAKLRYGCGKMTIRDDRSGRIVLQINLSIVSRISQYIVEVPEQM